MFESFAKWFSIFYHPSAWTHFLPDGDLGLKRNVEPSEAETLTDTNHIQESNLDFLS